MMSFFALENNPEIFKPYCFLIGRTESSPEIRQFSIVKIFRLNVKESEE